MIRLNRYRREDIRDLEVGDLIKSIVLHQSRTGMIVRTKLRGRIESIAPEDVAAGQPPAFVAGRVRGKHGIVQPFKLSHSDRVYRKVEKVDHPAATQSAVPNEGQHRRDTEKAG